VELKDILIISLAIGGWGWGIIQFFVNRKNQKKDKAIEKRFDVYSAFMNKVDEMSANTRNDPQMIIGITNSTFSRIINGDEEEGNLALIEMNVKLMELAKNGVKSTMIINQEFNKVQLVCSSKLLPKIDEYKALFNDYMDEIQNILDSLSGNTDINKTAQAFQRIGQTERTKRFGELHEEVKKQMREEIGFYNK
jgi:hypothetical protein